MKNGIKKNLWGAESVAFQEEVGKGGEAFSVGRGGHIKLGRAEAEVVEMPAELPKHFQLQPIIEGVVQ